MQARGGLTLRAKDAGEVAAAVCFAMDVVVPHKRCMANDSDIYLCRVAEWCEGHEHAVLGAL